MDEFLAKLTGPARKRKRERIERRSIGTASSNDAVSVSEDTGQVNQWAGDPDVLLYTTVPSSKCICFGSALQLRTSRVHSLSARKAVSSGTPKNGEIVTSSKSMQNVPFYHDPPVQEVQLNNIDQFDGTTLPSAECGIIDWNIVGSIWHEDIDFERGPSITPALEGEIPTRGLC